MLKPRPRLKRPLSLSEQGSDDYVCKLCLDKGHISSLFCLDGCWICSEHGEVNYRIPKHAAMPHYDYERELLYKELYGGHMSTALDIRQAREIVEFDQEQVNRLKRQFEADIYVPAQVTDPARRQALAQILAEVKVFYDLEPLSGEVTIGSFQGDKYGLIIQHQGWRKIARREAMKELGSLINFSRPEILLPTEIEQRMAHICQKCNGAGKFKNGNACNACNGAGKFDPKDVIAMEIKMTVLEEAKQFMAAGVTYDPIVGLGVWQPGGNNPTSKDPRWKCEVNAVKDCVRQRFSLTMAERFNAVFGQPVKFMTEDEAENEPPRDMGEAKVVRDEVEENIHALAEVHGFTITHPHLFVQTVKAGIASGLFGDEADFIQTMVDNDFEFEADNVDRFKDRMAAAKKGLYPLNLLEGTDTLAPLEYGLLVEAAMDIGLPKNHFAPLFRKVFGHPVESVSRAEAHNFLYYLNQRLDGEEHQEWNKQLAQDAAEKSKAGLQIGVASEEVKPGEVIDG
jgi:hypothetical protein